MARILIAGCGYVGSALGERLAAASHEVWGLRRRPALLPEGIGRIEADLAVPGTLRELPSALDAVVYMAAPAGRDDALYRTAYVEGLERLIEALEQQAQRPQRVIFVSSTAVYAQSGGAWVDEDSPAKPDHFRGRRLLEAEGMLRSGPFPSIVVRVAGIYGPRRTRLLDRVRAGRAVFAPGKPHYTNRMHRDDCAGFLHHLLELEQPEDVYIGVDSEPEDEAVVLRWLAGALGAAPPRPAHGSEIKELVSRTSKRCRNTRLTASGYELLYPSFREGYTALIQELR